MTVLSTLDPIEQLQLKKEHMATIHERSLQLGNSIGELEVGRTDQGTILSREFIIHQNRILVLSLLPIGVGAWCRAHHAMFLDDIENKNDSNETFIVLMPRDVDDLKSLKNMHRAAVRHQRQIGFFPHASAPTFRMSSSDIESTTLKIDQSLSGQSLSAVITNESATINQLNFSVMQVFLAQMHLQFLGFSHGDASVNNFIIAPDMAAAVAIDLSTLKRDIFDIELNDPIATVFDPAVGPLKRNRHVDPFVLTLTTLFMFHKRLDPMLSVHISEIYKLCYPRSIYNRCVLSPTIIDVTLDESDDLIFSPRDSDSTDESPFFELSPIDKLECLDDVQSRYELAYQSLGKLLEGQPTSIIAFLIQCIAPTPERRPELWDYFNCTTIKNALFSQYLPGMVKENYTSNQAEHCLRQLQLIDNSALSEHPNFNGCLSVFAILVYGCCSCKAHPLAIRQQVDNLLAIIVQHMPDFFQVPLLVDRSLSNSDGIKTFADILRDLESMLKRRESLQSIDCQIYDPFLELLKEEIDSIAADSLQDEAIKPIVSTLVDDMIEEIDIIAGVTTLLDDMVNAIENPQAFCGAAYKNSPSPNSVRLPISVLNACLFNPVNVKLNQQILRREPTARQSLVR